MQKPVNLGCDGTRFLSHPTVDDLADHHFTVEGIGLAMLRLGLGGRGDGSLETWIAAMIGAECGQRG
jgi:hypothetical protein